MRSIALVVVLLFMVATVSGQTVSGPVTLTATASDVTAAVGDTECGVGSVQFFNGTVPISPVLTEPNAGNDYVFKWDTKDVPNGNYAIAAVAKDKAGASTDPAKVCDGSQPNSGTSNVLNIVVNNQPLDSHGPTVVITITVTVRP